MEAKIEVGQPRTPEDLHTAMNAAFSDYLVPLVLPYEHFKFMMIQRGFSPALSRVAMADGQIVSFWLIAMRTEDPIGSAYTIATGTLPEFRRRGLAERVFCSARSGLVSRGFSSLRLEVIKENQAAESFYAKVGFETIRELLCFRLNPSALAPSPQISHKLRALDLRSIEDQLEELLDWPPSWQNSLESLSNIAELVTVLGAFEGERCLGYGALIGHNGVLAQIAVRPEHRRKGLGTAILAALAEGQPVLEITNIDSRDQSSRAFFEALGAEFHVGQSEMAYHLKSRPPS